MRTFAVLTVFLTFICGNVTYLYCISTRLFIRIRYRIPHLYGTTIVLNRRRNYRRQNSLTDLHEAVLQNCEESVRCAIAAEVPIDLVDHAQRTALYYACERGLTKLVRILLEYGARHDIVDSNQISPLWIAAKEGHDDIVFILLKEGANPNQKANEGTTALYQSSYEGHWSCVYHLIRYKASVNDAKNSGASPLFVAGRNGHYRIVKHLLKNGANPIQTQQDLRSPLHTALMYDRAKCVQLLLRSKADCLLEQCDIYGWSHLHFLAKKGSLKAARSFFHDLRMNENSIDLNRQDSFGNTALHISIFNGQKKFASYLLNKGLNPHLQNLFGWTYQEILEKSEKEGQVKTSVPQRYLHDLLSRHRIEYTEEEDLIRKEIEEYVKVLVSSVTKLNPLFRNNVICSGSYYEGTRVGAPDEFDYMINLSEIERLCFFVENDSDPSGFGRLYPNDQIEGYEQLLSYLEPTTGCLSAEKIRKQFYQLLTSVRAHVIRKEVSEKFQHLKFEWTSGDKRCGTTIQAEWYGRKYPYLLIKIDVVPCLTISTCPRVIKQNYHFEPSQFNVIARSPTSEQIYLWRISTSQAESVFFQRLHNEQKNGYLSLKILRKLNPYKCEIDHVIYTDEELITSYMFKNEFHYEHLRYPHPNQWTAGNLNRRVSTILKRLYRHLLIGSIKSFYLNNYNVIDSEDYRRFRKFEIKYVRILIEKLQENLQELNKKPARRHTFVAQEPITEKPFLRERALSNDPTME